VVSAMVQGLGCMVVAVTHLHHGPHASVGQNYTVFALQELVCKQWQTF